MKKVLSAGVAVVVAVALLAFEPWTAWTRSTVNEPLPVAVSTRSADARTPSQPVPDLSALVAQVEPVDLAVGEFVTQEHRTSGRARVVSLPDGRRILRFEGFSTSNGPDLHVWLSDRSAGGNWFKYDEGRSVALGELKATDGSHNYVIPADVDLDGIASAVIWCKRFKVAFGSAALDL